MKNVTQVFVCEQQENVVAVKEKLAQLKIMREVSVRSVQEHSSVTERGQQVTSHISQSQS